MTLVLTTPRLTVRQFTPGDAPELHGICGDRRTMRYVGDGMVLSQTRCAEWIEQSLVDYATRGYGASAVYVQGDPVMAGYCGIVAARRRADPEIIYALRPNQVLISAAAGSSKTPPNPILRSASRSPVSAPPIFSPSI